MARDTTRRSHLPASLAGESARTASVSSAPSPSDRITAVDVLRGITIVGMLVVNDPGDAEHVYTPLAHSVWNGCSLADLVFPFFLFVVGITTQLSLSRRASTGTAAVLRAIARRAAIIFGLGLMLNAYPFFEKNIVAGPDWLPAFFGHIVARFSTLRIMGVLQRIAIAYLAASLIVRRASTRTVAIIAGAILLGYWAAMTVLPVPGEGVTGAQVLHDPARNLSAWVDRVTLDWTRWGLGWHLWDRAEPYDPEGLFSTIPAVATVLLGVLTGRWMQSRYAIVQQMRLLAVIGVGAMLVGVAWNHVLPINKPIWSSSYVVFTAGAAALSLALVAWCVDVMRWRRWSEPFLVFGMNPIVAYVGAEFVASVLRSSIKFKVGGHRLSTGMTVVRGFEALGIEARLASLMWAVCFVLLCYTLLRVLYNRRLFVRV